MNAIKDAAKLQKDYRGLVNSGRLSKKAMCDICIPFRDKYGLTDIQTLQIARNELSLSKMISLLDNVNTCEYCKGGFSVLNTTMEYSGIEFALMKNSIRARYYPSHEYTTFQTQDIVNIEFCPMCGREL